MVLIFELHQSHLEDLLKHKLVGPTVRFSDSGRAPELAFLTDYDVNTADHTLRTNSLASD